MGIIRQLHNGHDDIGLWCEFGQTDRSFRPAPFLDRDGVVIADADCLGRAEAVPMVEGIAAWLARYNALPIPVVPVTDPSGIASGEQERQEAALFASARFVVEIEANPADALAGVFASGRLAPRLNC